MFYNRHGSVVHNVLPNHDSRKPIVEYKARKAKPLTLRLSRSLVPMENYDILIGRGSELGLIAIKWSLHGEYLVKIKPQVCEIRLAPFRGMKNVTYQSSFQVGRQVLIVPLPPARHELERWWYKLPDVSDNPGDRLRQLSNMHGV